MMQNKPSCHKDINTCREVILIDTKNRLMLYVVCICLFVALAGWYLLSSGLPDHGVGSDKIRADIQSAIEQQSSAAERLSSIEAGLDDSASKVGDLSAGAAVIAESVTSAQGRIDESAQRAQSSQRLVEDGQRILGQIRSRGQI